MLEKGKKYFIQGNIACAEAAIIAGCRFFAAYPITPASEIGEKLAELLPMVGGKFIQMEDEIASINAVIGASWAGVKAMTATSGPGFSLMQEGIGYAFMTETPCVIVVVQRVGPATGQASKGAQGNFYQARWGTHGDYSTIVLSPNSVQEMFDLTIKAFNYAEEYRTPVILLTDELTAHIFEQVEVPEKIEIKNRRLAFDHSEPFFDSKNPLIAPPMPQLGAGLQVLVTGSTHNEWGYRYTHDPKVHRRLITRLYYKIEGNAKKICEYELKIENRSKIGIVSYGCSSRSAYGAIEILENRGERISYLRLKTLWPFPDWAVEELAENVEIIIVPELSLGQLVREVERASHGKAKVISLSKIGGGELITPQEIIEAIRRL
ncbi:MAG: 2-oxoacid:acceptor oxidoreductase subunit alpha [Candidatus Methanomethylicia archaeon]|nr:2-oxoacid:acceptor oxidoreductase subunit alpha [Candidatus Methanomethylicia archaeon]MCX8169026.1 2-oxoacid:acceptor oxidoreductase subunit alpha [Candidatus Methanomethylicia archaeon]MDW7988758.1 2-oxoacid:acceptor oxidoreductase subunit alpha [Nitrososphaerota archaeon]